MKQLWFEFDNQKISDPDSGSSQNKTISHQQNPCQILDARQAFKNKRSSRFAEINNRIALLSEKWWRKIPN